MGSDQGEPKKRGRPWYAPAVLALASAVAGAVGASGVAHAVKSEPEVLPAVAYREERQDKDMVEVRADVKELTRAVAATDKSVAVTAKAVESLVESTAQSNRLSTAAIQRLEAQLQRKDKAAKYYGDPFGR